MSLLLDERPVVLQPSLVRRLGILEAAIVQQLHYWGQRSTHTHEGESWVYKTYADWADEIGVTSKAARGALDRMRRDELILSISNPTNPRDRTLWWRVDYAVLGIPSAPGDTPNAPAGTPSAPGGSSTRASESRTESTTEITSESARAIDAWPDSLPSEIPAEMVLEALTEIAADHGAKPVTRRAVGHAILSAPGRDYLGEAHKMASYFADRKVRDAVATYRNWLGNADPAGTTNGLTSSRRGGWTAREMYELGQQEEAS